MTRIDRTTALTKEQIMEFVEASKNMTAGNVELSGDSLEMFRSVMNRRPPPQSLLNREYNQHDDPDGEAKQRILEDFTSEVGCCYMQLVTASDTVLKLKVGDFGLFLAALRQEMGRFPMAIDASYSVAQVFAFWKNGVSMNSEECTRAQSNAIQLLAITVQEEMMQSSARFKLIETSAGFHVSATTFGPCGCPGRILLCDHGWASRYVLCAIIKPERRLGASKLDFDDFFESVVEEPEEMDPEVVLRESREKLERLERANEKMQEINYRERKAKKQMNDIGWESARRLERVNSGETLHEQEIRDSMRMEDLNNSLRREIEAITRDRNEIINQLSKDTRENLRPDPLRFQTGPAETIVADDSASNLGPFHVTGMFMKPGTVVADANTRFGKSNLGRTVTTRLPDVPESAIGFVQTEETYAGDVAARQSVVPINGLSKPFNNSRLNLLGHVYTGLNIINRESDSNNFYVTLSNLRRSKLNSPPVQLFRQVLNCTFDWEEGLVKSNPFNLPYIEVGMTISEDSLIKCFDLLNSEYRNLWFSEMKQMQVPAFANEFSSLSDFSLKGSKRNSLFSGSKTSEALSEDRYSEGSSAKGRESNHSRRSNSSRKNSNSSSRSSILGFPTRQNSGH